MKIKKLELCGFKSFVDKTTVHFDHDIIGIVGPNGCGKSNIVDAIRWCMGEQSAKNLRGRSMEDVIFNGSDSRSGSEFSEVTLTFENDDGDVPIEYKDYPEIAVTRRLNRTGDSDYLINKVQVRLKDVTDLFLGTGVGTKAYSIIEQGKVGLIVSAKPEDRRILIEEAAGITKYKARKKQAERKMEMTQQNLLRVGDIVAEIERNLGSLKRQAAKAERFLSYRNELEDLCLYEAAHKYLELHGRIGFEGSLVTEHTLEADRLRSELVTGEAALEAARLDARGVEERLDQAQTANFSAENSVRAEEAAILRAEDRLAQISEREKQAIGEQQALADQRVALEGELQGLVDAVSGFALDEASQATLAADADANLALRLEEHRTAMQTLDELRAREGKARSEIAVSEARLASFDQRREEAETRLERWKIERENLGLDKADTEGRSRQLVREVENLRLGKGTSAEERARLEEKLTELKREIGESERLLEAAKGDVTKKRSRLHALVEVHARHEGVGQGAKALLGMEDPRLCSLVADHFEVPADCSAAVAGFLGARVQEVVADDLDRGVECLGELASARSGRATIVPARPSFVSGSTPDIPRGEGILGLLIDHVLYDEQNEALVRAMFGATLLVNDVATARTVAGWPAAVVALDGTVVHVDGRISGGTGEEIARGMLDSKRETRELGEEVEHLDQVASDRLARHQELRSSIAEIQSALERARNQAHADELALVHSEKDHRAVVLALESIVQRLEKLDQEIVDLARQLEEAKAEREAALVVVHESRTILLDVETQVVAAQTQSLEASAALDDARARLTERKVVLATAREKLVSAQGAKSRLERSRDELGLRSDRLSEELTQLKEQFEQTNASILEHRETLQRTLDEARDCAEALSQARTEYEAVKEDLGMREGVLKSLRQTAEEAKERLTQHEMALREAQLEMEHLVSGVAEKFRGIRLARIIGDYHLRPPPNDEIRTRITELQHLIDRMGSVNLDAMREHDEAEQRYTFYSTQKADLEKALADLERAIQQMNRESKRLFAETFEAVNRKFQEVFPRMFRGGRASLRLTNPDDMLETGIDVLAQPPGKKLASIELMSGGEKALTAVSLIFSIFQIKPSPFCILDEVDAPLDEANVARYNEMVRSMTDRSQFILITHIKQTMQLVDVLYGVTMQESGVSRLVSVKLSDTATARKSLPAAEEAMAVA